MRDSLFFFLLLLPVLVSGHARLTVPATRPYTYNGGSNAPAWTCSGPVFGTSPTSMRCHDVTTSSTITTVRAGSTVHMEWVMEAAHPGDCSIWLSYDTDTSSPQNWIKIKDLPGCLAKDGLAPPAGSIDVEIPANLPDCEHCVLRWEWYAVQQVSNVEFYVNCADIKIVGGNPSCPKPRNTVSISGIDHLKENTNPGVESNSNGASPLTGCPFYNPYNGVFNKLRTRGPREWTPEPCSGGSAPTPAPTTRPTSAPTSGPTSGPTSAPTTAPTSAPSSEGIVDSTGALWDGSFSSFVGNNDFCNCLFGKGCKYICSGGGANGGGGNCDPNSCSSGQYTFTKNEGWTIKVANGGSPQRAFAYAPFCGENGKNSDCLTSPATFTFSFNFNNVASWQGYIKILFFGDGNDVIGLWPNKGMKLVIFPAGDLPTSWQAEMQIKENVWYDVTMTLNFPSDSTVSIREAGGMTYSGSGWSSNKVSLLNRAQIGVYTWAPTGPAFSLKLRNLCAGTKGKHCLWKNSGSSGSSGATCPADDGWPVMAPGVMASRPCPSGTTGTFNRRTCGTDGVWGQVESDCKAVDACASVKCQNGVCSTATGKCVCNQGFSGTLCDKQSSQCPDCNALNRATCSSSSSTCGACLNGYTASSAETNSLCSLSCKTNCGSLNRQPCSAPDVCGACKTGFVEPSSGRRSDACTAPSSSSSDITFGVGSQWETGFCGSIKTKCPFSGSFSFSVPADVTFGNAWNMENARQVGATISGNCPSWAGANVFEAGFCATKANKAIAATTKGFAYAAGGVAAQGALLGDYSDVSLILSVENLPAESVNSAFTLSTTQEISLSLGGGYAVSLQSFTVEGDRTTLFYRVQSENKYQTTNAYQFSQTTLGGFKIIPDSVIINPSPSAAQLADDTTPNSSTSSGLSSGAIAGIVIGCVVGALLLVGLVAFFVSRSSGGSSRSPIMH